MLTAVWIVSRPEDRERSGRMGWRFLILNEKTTGLQTSRYEHCCDPNSFLFQIKVKFLFQTVGGCVVESRTREDLCWKSFLL
jgi:hypothetical protein